MAQKTIQAFGQELTPEQWAKRPICRCSPDEIRENIRLGMSPADAITTPSKRRVRFKGISYHKNNNRWVAQIKIEGKVRFLGQFATDVEAAQAYDDAAGPLGRVTNFRETA